MIELIVEKLINMYCADNDRSYEQIADDLSTEALHSSESLSFLSHYRGFKKFSQQPDQLPLAAKHVVSLLTSTTCPKKFWASLLMDCIPLLEHECCLFNSNETMDLMRCCTEAAAMSDSNTGSGWDKILDNVKLALSRNLARAFIMEAS